MSGVDRVGPRRLDARHALFAGWVTGIAAQQGVELRPVCDSDGMVTDHVVIERVSVADLVTWVPSVQVVIPYPPDDWQP